MRGHIRRRGKTSFEYIVDIGSASAQRCQSCGRRFWVERKPRECCPKCGGELIETDERRRAIKGGFATRKECQAALNKVLSAVEASTYAPPTRITVKVFLLTEWLPTVRGSAATDHLRQLCDAHPRAHHPAPGSPPAAETHSRCHQRPLRPPLRTRSRPRRRSALGLLGAPRARRPAPRLPRRRALGTPQRQPGGGRRSAQGKCRAPRQAAGVERRAAQCLP